MKAVGLAILWMLAGLPQEPAPGALAWGPDPAKKYTYKTIVEITFKYGEAKVEVVEEIERLATLEDGTLRIGSRFLSVDMTWTAGQAWEGGDEWNAGAWSSTSGKEFPYTDSPFHVRPWVELPKNHWLYAMSKNGKITGGNVFGSLKAMREGARKPVFGIWPEPTIPYYMLKFPVEAKKTGDTWDEKSESPREKGGRWGIRREGKVTARREGRADLELRTRNSVMKDGKNEVESTYTATVTWNDTEGMPEKCSLAQDFPDEPIVKKCRFVSELIRKGPKDP